MSFLFSDILAQQTDYTDNNDELIQFSGLILSSDSIYPLPFATVYITNKKQGTISDINGFFSLVLQKGDTLEFSYLGYHKKSYIVPGHLSIERYSIIQLLTQDTLNLPETVIYPWPTKELFKEAFIKAVIPDDDLARAKKNIKQDKLRELGQILPYDGKENGSAYLREFANSFYTYGYQPQPNNFLNPFAWAQFIKAWQDGAFKRKK